MTDDKLHARRELIKSLVRASRAKDDAAIKKSTTIRDPRFEAVSDLQDPIDAIADLEYLSDIVGDDRIRHDATVHFD